MRSLCERKVRQVGIRCHLSVLSWVSLTLILGAAQVPLSQQQQQQPVAQISEQLARSSAANASIHQPRNQHHQGTNYVNQYEQQASGGKHPEQQQQQQQQQQQWQTPAADGDSARQDERPRLADVEQQQQQQQQQYQNITRLLIERFSFLFSQEELAQFEQQDSLFRGQLLLDKLTLQTNLSDLQDEMQLQQQQRRHQSQSAQHQQQEQSSLETRTLSLIQSNLQKLTSINLSELNQAQQKRSYIRVLNRVFSRAELPDSFMQQRNFQRTSGLSRSTASGGGGAQSTSGGGGGQPAASGANAHCANHIGCIAELPNFPMILKLKPNVSASFTIYTRERGVKGGQRILFEPLMHYQLREGVDAQTTMNELVLQKEVISITKQLKLLPVVVGGGGGGGGSGGPQSAGGLGGAAGSGPGSALGLGSAGAGPGHRRRNHLVGGGPLGGAAVAASKQQASKLLSSMATSWISANKIAQARELPFDLAALEQSNFNASLTTRVIIGGYFAKEDEEWIEELVRQWLLLEPSNVIKVSWQDSNRGLYHSAAYNSRIVGRQLSLFLHYLNELFHIDLNKFHLVGHSLGAHIAGFVGADAEGQIARITGLDPAGPIFVELPAAHRLDASDAKFVDVLHTNGGTITKGALGLSTPSGHVDYYCNGGALQPGCFFSSVTMSIMDPVERIACNHRRSYRYFTEIIKLAISEQRNFLRRNTMQAPGAQYAPAAEQTAAAGLAGRAESATGGDQRPAGGALEQLAGDSRRFPHAFLFEAKQEDLVRLVQPELKLSLLLGGAGPAQSPASPTPAAPPGAGQSQAQTQSQSEPQSQAQSESQAQSDPQAQLQSQPPLKKQIEFHQLNPEFPRDKRGLYFFKTRQEAPFFASKQYALRLTLDQPIRRKITLLVKINATLVAEIEFDESHQEQSHQFVFVPGNPNLIDHAALFSGRSSKAPDLWLMWRQRSFNLLLAHQAGELHVNSLELLLLDENESQTAGGGGGDPNTSGGGAREGQAGDESAQGDQAPVNRNVASAKLMRQQLGINDYLIRYELNTVNQQQLQPQSREQQQQQQHKQEAGGGAGANARAEGTSRAQQANASGGNSFVIARNQWHKFDGRPVAIE